MKKHKLLLSLVIVIAFLGGILTEKYLLKNSVENEQTDRSEKMNIRNASSSSKKPEQKQQPKFQLSKEKVLIGYIQDFRDPNRIDYASLSHVIFSFAHPTKDGQIILNGETAVHNLRNIVANAHKYNTKVMLAIGGWFHIDGGESYSYFKAAISDSAARTKLVGELIHIVDRENLDGIDIDFEHPRSTEDAHHLAAFAKELSDILHPKNKELSIAVNAKVHSVAGTEIQNVVYEPSMFEFFDHVNIMAYDGQWDGEYNAANLSPYSYSENIVNYWSKLFEAHELSKEKLVLGLPLYAQPENQAIKQVSYAAIVNSNPEYAKRDTVSMNGTIYHFNGVQTVQKKIKLALDHRFGGMMLWELGHDISGSNSMSAIISKQLKEANVYGIRQD